MNSFFLITLYIVLRRFLTTKVEKLAGKNAPHLSLNLHLCSPLHSRIRTYRDLIYILATLEKRLLSPIDPTIFLQS